MLEPLLSLLWALICCAVVLLLAYWFTKHVVGRGRLGNIGVPGGAKEMEVLAQLAMGKDQRLCVVRTGGRYFLLGISAAQINCLAEFTPEEAEVWCRQTVDPAQQPPSFSEALQKVLKDKWRG